MADYTSRKVTRILPEPWQIQWSKTHNKHYYYNPKTRESTYKEPK